MALRRLKFLLPVLLFAALLVVFFRGLYQDPTLVPSPFIGKPAPDFILPALNDPQQTVSMKQWRGEVSLVNVWASWCPGCAREHEMLMRIAREGDVPIFGLNWKDERQAALKWLQQRGDPYVSSAWDFDNVAGLDWGVYGAPETFLLDRHGIIRYKLVGPLTEQIWQEEFLPRIRAAREAG